MQASSKDSDATAAHHLRLDAPSRQQLHHRRSDAPGNRCQRRHQQAQRSLTGPPRIRPSVATGGVATRSAAWHAASRARAPNASRGLRWHRPRRHRVQYVAQQVAEAPRQAGQVTQVDVHCAHGHTALGLATATRCGCASGTACRTRGAVSRVLLAELALRPHGHGELRADDIHEATHATHAAHGTQET